MCAIQGCRWIEVLAYCEGRGALSPEITGELIYESPIQLQIIMASPQSCVGWRFSDDGLVFNGSMIGVNEAGWKLCRLHFRELQVRYFWNLLVEGFY